MKLSNRAATFALSVLCVVVLSACPPEWGEFDGGATAEPEARDDAGVEPDAEPGVDAGPAVLLDGGVDGGVDAGPAVLPDGGVNDGGADGGDVDGGDVDGGDAGLIDGGPPIDAGPVCVFEDPTQGWTCEGPSGTFADCTTDDTSPVVDFESICPATYSLQASGMVRVKVDEQPSIRYSDCGAALDAPARFTDLVAYDADNMVAYGRGETGLCSIINGNCFCGPTINPLSGVAFPLPGKVVIATENAFIFEYEIATETQIELASNVEGVVKLASVNGGADRYRVAVYTESGGVQCFDRVGSNEVVFNELCPGQEGNPIDTFSATLFDESEAVANEKLVSAFLPGGNFFASAPLNMESTAPSLRFRSASLNAEVDPLSFAAIGEVNQTGSRHALGFPGGAVQVALGGDVDFSTIIDLPDDAAELGAIRVIAPGRDSNLFVTGDAWAVADTGVWFVPAGDTAAPTFTSVDFGLPPAAAAVVLVNDDLRLAVGLPDGVIRTFSISGLTLTVEQEFVELASSSDARGDDYRIPELILGVASGTTSHIVVVTTGGTVWAATNLNGTQEDLVEQAGLNFYSQLGGLNDDRFVISAPGRSSGALLSEDFWVTAKDGDAFVARAFRIQANEFAGTAATTLQNTGGDLINAGAPTSTPAAFRFHADIAPSGGGALTWTTDTGAAVKVGVNQNDGAAGPSTSVQPTPPFPGGAISFNSSATCGLVFAANSSQWVHIRTGAGNGTAPAQPTPGGIRINVVTERLGGLPLAGGDGGHLYRVTAGTNCATTTLTELRPIFLRPTNDITALKWRGPNVLMVGDSVGRLWAVGVNE